jgi:DNA-binding protein HU-beta
MVFSSTGYNRKQKKFIKMRKADIVSIIADKTGVPKVDVLVTIESFIKEVKSNLSKGEHIYIRGFGSYIVKKRAAKIGRNIKKNVAVEIPEHYIPAFKPSKEFVAELKDLDPGLYKPADLKAVI